MKKKYFFCMLAILFVAVMGVGLISCGGDDGDGGGSSSITGTWTGQGTGEDENEKVTIVFRSNGTGFPFWK